MKSFGVRDHAALNALWIGIQFQDASILAIVVPALLLRLAPQDHTYVLSLLATLAAVAVAFVPPFAGALSDAARRRGGDRRTQTAVALAVDVIALVVMAYSTTIGALGVALVAATIAVAAASAIYQVLLPEVVPRRAWGTAAGVRGVMFLAGTVTGLLAAALLSPPRALLVTAAVVTVSIVSLAAIPRTSASPPPTAHAVVRDRHDLLVTLIARGWIVLGMTLLTTYVLFFFNDVLGVRDASLSTGMVAGAALLGAIVSSVLAGVLSDRIDRRLVVALSGVPMTVAALGFALAPDVRFIFLYSGLFGLGYGGVFSVGWALALDAIPELGDVARDLGVWGTLSNLPSIAAPVIGAWIIAHGATPRDGYRWLFALAGASFAIGSLVVLRVGRRPVVPTSSSLLVALTCIVRQPIISLSVRVRQWGRLPRRRGPTMLIANHQHQDESEILVERTFVQGPWRAIFAASSRRMHEPGFFAWRMPWLAPFTRGLNASPLLVALGLLPLENELGSRRMRSLAHGVWTAHGDLPLAEVFDPSALATAPRDARMLSDLFGAAHFAVAGQTVVKLAHVREPYRRELLDDVRATIDADIAHIVERVRRGATFFVTAEGFYSTDGRMRPLKGIVRHVAPYADVRLAAIAFDPFRGRRLSLLYRVVRPVNPGDLATSLAAARPVTTSALLATWLLAVALPFTEPEAVDGVVRARDALPPGAFVDPELARDAERCVRDALDGLSRRGILVREGTRFALAPDAARTDRRFPNITDVVVYQAAFLAETVDAVRRLSPPGVFTER